MAGKNINRFEMKFTLVYNAWLMIKHEIATGTLQCSPTLNFGMDILIISVIHFEFRESKLKSQFSQTISWNF